jgi:flagellin
MERTARKDGSHRIHQLQQGSCIIFKEENIMSMVVQHNLTAMNSNRQLGVTTSAQAKSSEKLSSGYKINRAGDDAAGLKISEKMRSQIRGLNKASDNAEDGISLIQTAEGALNEAHSILQRMNELAVQGANDTNESIDREAINEELSQLTTELDRISTTTQFNKQNLLDGTFTEKNLHVGANANQKIAISIGSMNATSLGLKSVQGTLGGDKQTGNEPVAIKYQGTSYKYDTTISKGSNVSAAKATFSAAITAKYTASNYAARFDADTGSVYYTCFGSGTKHFSSATAAAAKDVSMAIADMKKALDDSETFKLYVTTDTTSAKALSSYTVDQQVSVSNYDLANASITAIQNAINKVSSQRSALGAIQNRLEHTVANLDNVSENTQSAESRIRDTDMASEMVEYSKNNILAQAGQSMLAQANQATQGVLSLLQ